MWNAKDRKIKDLENELDEFRGIRSTLEKLEVERSDLKREVGDLKSQKKIEEQEIKHLVKIKDEKRDLEYQKREVEADGKRADEIAKVKDSYQNKVEKHLEKRNDELKEMYTEVLSIVPKVEALVEIGGNNKKSK